MTCVKVRGAHGLGMADAQTPPPDAESLYQAALFYLARYSATRASLRQVLERRINRWARTQADKDVAEPLIAAAHAAVEPIIERLVRAGAINDAAFAEARARGLMRAGKSARSIQLRLVAKGVAAGLAREAAAAEPENELAAALVLLRRRRMGPFRTGVGDRSRELAVLARAGFGHEIAAQALDIAADEAEQRILELRR